MRTLVFETFMNLKKFIRMAKKSQCFVTSAKNFLVGMKLSFQIYF